VLAASHETSSQTLTQVPSEATLPPPESALLAPTEASPRPEHRYGGAMADAPADGTGAIGSAAPQVAGFPPPPGPDECHVWAVAAGELEPAHEFLLSLLDPPERARASRHRSRQAAQLFVASRAAQRILAGRYLSRGPASVTIDRRCRHCGDPCHGRPLIGVGADGPDQQHSLDYSVTHAGQLLLVAYVSDGLVGVDAEPADRRVGIERLARYALSPAEAALVSAAPDERQRAVFCRLWTRKEAVLKLTGRGLGAGLRSVDVSADTVPAGLATGRGGWPAGPVRLTDLDLRGVNPDKTREYVAALAATGPARRVTIRRAAGFLAALCLGRFRPRPGSRGNHRYGDRQAGCPLTPKGSR
jgi:4'-phosphopantetheinyl transferase